MACKKWKETFHKQWTQLPKNFRFQGALKTQDINKIVQM